MSRDLIIALSRTFKLVGSSLVLLIAALMALHANPAAAACGGVSAVANETELGTAITAFNVETTSPCVFSISLSGDIALSQNLPDIYNYLSGISLVIEGNGFAVDAQGIAGVRPFAVQPNATVTMNDLTITGGNKSGGGFSNKGGGIMNRGTLTLNRSTVSHNTHSDRGGGIANSGTLTVNQSTISNNVLPAGDHLGAGIYAEGSGSQITITNSTLSEHDHQHAIYLTSGDLTLDSVTITDNEYGLFISGVINSIPHIVNITNSILDGNGVGRPDDNCYFPFRGINGRVLNDGGHNLVEYGDDTCGIIGGQNGNVSQTSLLGPLADNGGPTQTHAPLLGSPVLDAGATILYEDQRGHPRPLGPAADIGSYEDVQCLGTDTGCGLDVMWFRGVCCNLL